MMEIKSYKSTVIAIDLIFLTWGPTCPGLRFGIGPNYPVPMAIQSIALTMFYTHIFSSLMCYTPQMIKVKFGHQALR